MSRARHLAHGAHVIVLHRLLEPEEAELLERTPDADRAAHRVAGVGVEGAGRVDAARTRHTGVSKQSRLNSLSPSEGLWNAYVGTTSGGEREIVRQCDRPVRHGGPSFLTTH
jgi:hypothetical protein